ncbi:HTH domain-containing protein [Paenibacillus dendritiformis]|uniref:HTH domain-containing protein n=2 Tax=Paenibacillus dendritiformis TaxID=130049 RepID=UPI000A005C0E
MTKADSMLAISWLLTSRRRMTAKELADQLEVLIRTVYRCIDGLRERRSDSILQIVPNEKGRNINGRFPMQRSDISEYGPSLGRMDSAAGSGSGSGLVP